MSSTHKPLNRAESSRLLHSTEPWPIDDVFRSVRDRVGKPGITLIATPTGSGKSSRLALLLAEHAKTLGAQVICTQPKRVAAKTLWEHTKAIGASIGVSVAVHTGDMKASTDYLIRTRPDLQYVTEGVLRNGLQNSIDKSVKSNHRTLLLLDEVHEQGMALHECMYLIRHAIQYDYWHMHVFLLSATPLMDILDWFGQYGKVVVYKPIVIKPEAFTRQHELDTIYRPLCCPETWSTDSFDQFDSEYL